jgi:hypothetical protein
MRQNVSFQVTLILANLLGDLYFRSLNSAPPVMLLADVSAV